jgi:hypothetical protein
MKRSKTAKRSRKAAKSKKATKGAKRTEGTVKPVEEAETANSSAPAVAPPKPTPVAAEAPKPATLTATGTRYAVLAGRPSKQAVTAVFGTTGYALSWVARAIKLNTTPEALCERFKTDPESVKSQWEASAAKKA